MSSWNDVVVKVVEWLMATSWQACLLTGLIVSVQWLFRGVLSARWRYMLWLLLVIRLLVPSLPESPTSVYRYVPTSPIRETVAEERALIFLTDAKSASPSARPSFGVPSSAQVKEIVFKIWSAGVLVLFAMFVWRNVVFHRLISRCGKPADSSVCELARSIAIDMKMYRSISIIEITGLDNPAVTGLLDYKLLLPKGMAQKVSGKTLEMIFRHELAHLKRGDLWINFLTSILQVFHWFNPIIWWAFARMRDDRELATDALALSFSKSAGEVYGNTLLELASGSPSRISLSPSVGILENHRQMLRRIEQIALLKHNAYAWSSLGAVLLLILGLLALTKTPARAVTPVSVSQSEAKSPPVYVWFNKIGIGFFGPIRHDAGLSDGEKIPDTGETLYVWCKSFTPGDITLEFVASKPSGPQRTRPDGSISQPVAERHEEKVVPVGKIEHFRIFNSVEVTVSPTFAPLTTTKAEGGLLENK
jgi:bla regulator protein BlaR1